MTVAAAAERRDLIGRALRLEALTLGWLVVEAAVAIGAGVAAHSLTLITFGADSVIELASAGVLLWRLVVELRRDAAFPEVVERRAARIAALLLLALAAYVVATAGWSLWTRRGQEFSLMGCVLALAAIPLMLLLARGKRRIAGQIGSAALRADAAEATACTVLSALVVVGLIMQWLVAAWWIDGITALVLAPFLVREAIEAWAGDDDGP